MHGKLGIFRNPAAILAFSGKYYDWKQAYAQEDQGLINSKPCPENPRLGSLRELRKRSSISEKPAI